MPNSVWLTNPGQYQPQATRVFLDSLQSVLQTEPVHQVEIYSLTTSPSPVARAGDVLVLPDAIEISVTMVLANTGNQAEDGLTVTASLSYAGNGPSSAQDVVDLAPGQAQSIVGLGPLAPPQGSPVTLHITVKPPSGSADVADRSVGRGGDAGSDRYEYHHDDHARHHRLVRHHQLDQGPRPGPVPPTHPARPTRQGPPPGPVARQAVSRGAGQPLAHSTEPHRGAVPGEGLDPDNRAGHVRGHDLAMADVDGHVARLGPVSVVVEDKVARLQLDWLIRAVSSYWATE